MAARGPRQPIPIAGLIVAAALLLAPLRGSAAESSLGRLVRRGHYEQAIAAARARAAGAGLSGRAGSTRFESAVDATLAAARAEMALGRITDARARLEQATVVAPRNLILRAELLRAADALGDRAAVAALVELSVAEWDAPEGPGNPLTPRSHSEPAALRAMALVARFDNDFQRANRLLREAVKASPRDPAANIEWGRLFLEKHAAIEALRSFDEALAVDPRHPDALVGKAHSLLERGYDREAAAVVIAAALTENPRHADALALQGELALDDEDQVGVDEAIARLRAVNPRAPGAAWLAAAAARIHDNDAVYARERDGRLAVRPRDGEFFANVAEALARQRRYNDARAVAEEGVQRAGEDPRCLSTLGTTLLRLGDEPAGLDRLRRAFKIDPYDTRTFNQLELFEKIIARDYTIFTTEHFRFRIQPTMRPAIEQLVAPFLEDTYRHYAARYGYQPPGPITVELYREPSHYAVRTVGLPSLDVAAVCFGPVITSQAPTNGRLNWGMVLAHELAHSFALGLSRERVPRWFTEGLAEVETSHLHPDWTRHDHLTLWGALKRERVPALADLSRAFLAIHTADDAVTAYMLAAQAVKFLEEQNGFARVRQALVDFGAGSDGRTTLARLAGHPIADLERDFHGHLVEQYRPFDAQFLPRLTERRPRADAERRARAPGAEADDLARAALAAFLDGDLPDARRWLLGAGIRRPTGSSPLAVYVQALLDEQDGDARGVIAGLSPLVENGRDGYDMRVRLGLAAVRVGDIGAALKHLRAAVILAPEEVEAWAFMAQVLERAGQPHPQLDAQIHAFRLDPQSGRLGREIVESAARLDAFDQLIEIAPMVTFVDPANPELHAAYARALRKLGRHREAIPEFERALAFGHKNPTEIRRELAELRASLKRP